MDNKDGLEIKTELDKEKEIELEEIETEEETEIKSEPGVIVVEKKHPVLKWFLGALIAILACAGVYALTVFYFSANIYEDDQGFEDFAYHEISKDSMLPVNGYADIDYEYDSPLSVAIRYDDSVGEEVAEKRDAVVQAMVKKCTLEAAKQDQEKAKEAGDDFIIPERAVLIDTCETESGTGAMSVAVYCKMYTQDGNKMLLDSCEIETLLLNSETYETIDSIQALNVNYKEKAAAFAKPYFEQTYGEKELKENWKKYVRADRDKNYNTFILTDTGIEFFFDQDTVVAAEEGITSVSIPSISMDSTIRAEVVDRKIDPDKPMVAITYDDGPGGDSESRIIECLKKNESVATFFYVGYRVEGFAYNGKAAAEIGCEIGNHSWDHPQLTTLSKKQINKQISKTNEAIEKYIGVTPTAMRPPYGDFNDKVLENVGLPAYLWTIDTLDWKTRNPKKIFRSVKKVKNLDGKIILMHSIYDETADASEKIIPWLKKQGYQTVTVSELIKYKTGNMPKSGEIYRKVK